MVPLPPLRHSFSLFPVLAPLIWFLFSSRPMGTDFQFPPQLMQQELLAFQESTFATV